METACASSEHEVVYWQLRAQAENLIGNHRAALAADDRLNYLRKPQRRSELPTGAGSLPALPYVLEQAVDHRVDPGDRKGAAPTGRCASTGCRVILCEFRGFADETDGLIQLCVGDVGGRTDPQHWAAVVGKHPATP